MNKPGMFTEKQFKPKMIMNQYIYVVKQALFCLSLLLLIAACNRNKNSKDPGEKEAEASAVRVDSLYVRNYLATEPEFKKHSDLMFLFYGERDYRLAWFRKDELVPEANKFLEAMGRSERDGLDPQEYRIKDFNALFQQYESSNKNDSTGLKLQKEIDLALTASYFNFASDFYKGKVDPEEVDHIEWNVERNNIKLHQALQTILQERDSRHPYYQFEALHEGYRDLRTALSQYRQIQQEGGWPKVEGIAEPLKMGDSSPVVPVLRRRLLPAPQASVTGPGANRFDEQLDQVVKAFQMRHGLQPDGVVGGETLRMMNVPVEERIDQILLNMERWRWVPTHLTSKEDEDKYIFVNIPEYKLYVVEGGKEVFDMRVIVGKAMHSTPIFSDKVEYVVMAPYWNVPVSIVVNEFKPRLISNPSFLESQDMELLNGPSPEAQPISPDTVDWSRVTEENFNYLIRQRPGPRNSLGLIKFMFPNEYDVYLHDTPAESLFGQTSRGFSHGCVRVEDPEKLASYLLSDTPEWNKQTIQETMLGEEEKWVTLKQKVPVYIVYFTAWVDKNGAIHFRDDVYGHDKTLARAYFE